MGLAGAEAWGQTPALLTRLFRYPKSSSACGEGEGGLLGAAFLSGPPFPWGAVGCCLPAPRVAGPQACSVPAWVRRATSMTKPLRPSGLLVAKPCQEPVFPASVATTCCFLR